MKRYTLNNDEAKKLILTKPIKINKSDALKDTILPKERQVERAKMILKSRKKL